MCEQKTAQAPTVSAGAPDGFSPYPTLTIKGNGLVVATNPAAAQLVEVGLPLDDLISTVGHGETPDAPVYALGRAAAQDGWATGVIMLRNQIFTAVVEATESIDQQIWRLLPMADDAAPMAQSTAALTVIQDPRPEGRASDPDPLDQLPVALARLRANGEIVYVNAATRELIGGRLVEGAQIVDLIEGLGKTLPDRLSDTMAGRAQGRSEVAMAKGGGSDGFLQVTMTRVTDPVRGNEILAVISDATELKTLEAQFVQSQKMQAVGQLAGGIAHDFNNLLTAISGYCDLLLLRHLQGDPDHSDLMQIRQNTNRAAALVRQLLAFSRKQTLRPQVLHLFDTLADLANLLNRLLGEKVELDIQNTEDIWPVRVDERQLEQVIVNLVVNARDAMPDGGVVGLRTQNVLLEEPLLRDRAQVPAGRYCLIEVIDSGCGIPQERITKIFEPFYTTKKVGEGTGLGLSTAYGIIKQMDGFIFVDSAINEGSVFRIYLPNFDPETSAEDGGEVPFVSDRRPPSEAPFKDTTGQGVVLLVEDEAPVRAFAARALQMRGYTVLEADSGEAALDLLSDQELKVDLFVSDVVMPGLDGPSWVRNAHAQRPDISTIFVSGYSEDMVLEGSKAVPKSSYLSKPFTLNALTERVREHMDTYVN